jgi:hypothetical protein
MTIRFTPFAPDGASPIQTANCAAGIPTLRVAAPSLNDGEYQGEKK